MVKKPTRISDSIRLIDDKPILEERGLNENPDVEARERKFRNAADKINRKYAGLFTRLSE